MSDPIEPYEQRTGVFGLACSLSVLQLWHWAPEWLHDFLDDWRYRLNWWQEFGWPRFFLSVLSFLSGLGFVLAMGAGLMWLWTPVTQPGSPDGVAEEVSEAASVTRSQASRPNVVVDVVPLAGPVQGGEPARSASEAIESDSVIEVEAFLATLEAPEPNPNWQAPVLAGVALEVLPRPPVPVLATPSDADPPPSLPIRAQAVLALPPDLSPAPAVDLAPDLARSVAVPLRSSPEAPLLPAPDEAQAEVPTAVSTAPADVPEPALDLSEIALAQPLEGPPEPAAVAAEPALPGSSRDFAVAEPVTSAPTIPEAAETVIAGADPPRLPVRPGVLLPGASQIAAEPIAPSIRPRSRDEAQAALRSEAVANAQPVRSEAPQCNIEVCAAAYRSFRASDCTYQPFEGPRQLCPEEAETAQPAQPVQSEAPQCNIEVCAAAYQSFRASDCTYQPFEGPRQLCTQEAETAQTVQSEAPQCNIDVCAAAYRSFRASDCTYQSFEGPRRLCTR